MVDAMRAMLDELMGKERDVPLPMRSNRNIKFNDPAVCKLQLAGLCPNRLFKNTKSDLGPCQYEVHDDHIDWEKIKGEYDKLDARDKDRYGYEKELMRYLDQLIRDMDRKIQKAKERAEKESAPRELRPEDRIRLDEVQGKMKEALANSQRLGEDGDVDGSMVYAQQAENFKLQHENLLKTLTQPERTMTVCDVCGVFINSTDNEQRRKDHLNGKQYLGWKAIRDKLSELQEQAEARRKEREARDYKPDKREDRSHSRELERPRGERERERSPGKGRREREYREPGERDVRMERRPRSPPRDYYHERDPREYYGDRDREYRRRAEVPPPEYYRGQGGPGGRGDYRERDRGYYEDYDRRRPY